MRKIHIFDTTLRDGEQSAGINLNTGEKLQIARQLERLGVDIIEAGFPASSPGDFEAVQKIGNTIKDSVVTGLARTVKGDIDATWEALKDAAKPHIHIFLATSPIHMEYMKNTPDQVVDFSVEAVKYARKKFPLVQWSAEDAFRSDWDFLVRIINEVIKAGATTINIPDTVGYATPAEYGALFKYLTENVTGIDKVNLSAHCHNDLGMATANTIAALENGANQVEGTINGIGERAGNVALEEVAVALHTRGDFYTELKTDMKLNEIKRTSQLVSQLTGVMIQQNKAVVGKNAFAHESGIHQHGMLENPETYEIITPELIGAKVEPLAMGKHSGRHAFRDRAVSMGFDLSEEKISEAFKAFKELADKKKEITEDDLFILFTDQQVQMENIPVYELQSVQVQYGTENVPTATITATVPTGEVKTKAATGAGSVEAIFNTLEEFIDGKVHILDYRVTSVGKGRDALGEAVINLSFNDEETTGRDVSQDVLEASAKAYFNAVNRKIIHESVRLSNGNGAAIAE